MSDTNSSLPDFQVTMKPPLTAEVTMPVSVKTASEYTDEFRRAVESTGALFDLFKIFSEVLTPSKPQFAPNEPRRWPFDAPIGDE